MPISIQKLGCSFSAEEVVRDLDVLIPSGSFASILGASGCGKSTLLRMIADLIPPTSGSISKDFDNDQTSRYGFVFQKPTLLPWLTALKNVTLPLQLSQEDNVVREAAADALRLVDLEEADHGKLPDQLSGGMQMRVSLARAFVTKPNIMLMDEPFSALDEVLRQQLCETTLRLWGQEGWTTVFVTHNVQEAVFLSQQIHIMAGKPASIVETIEVPFGERTANLRSTPEFLSLVADVGKRLRDAVEQDGLSAASGAGR